MKVIAMMPVRNEAWILPHSLACLSAFCDVILVSDQDSEDESREICRVPRVAFESPAAHLRAGTPAPRRRAIEGHNPRGPDADELVSLSPMRFIERRRDVLVPAPRSRRFHTVEHMWVPPGRLTLPYWGGWASRRSPWTTSPAGAAARPRPAGSRARIRRACLFHLQWMIPTAIS
jgi:hypothetical protein